MIYCRKNRKTARWARSGQRPYIGKPVATSNPPTSISLPSSAYGNGAISIQTLNGQPTLDRANGVLMARYEDAVYPDEEPRINHMITVPVNGVYGDGDSPHGSQVIN